MEAPDDDHDFNTYLAKLSPSERAEALAAAAAAKRAEERAEQRELERAIREKEEQRRREKQQEEQERYKIRGIGNVTATAFRGASTEQQRLVYIPKRKRAQLENENTTTEAINGSESNTHPHGDNKKVVASSLESFTLNKNSTGNRSGESDPTLTTKERMAVVQTYLGKSAWLMTNHNQRRNNYEPIKRRHSSFVGTKQRIQATLMILMTLSMHHYTRRTKLPTALCSP